jgi:hypothetical protein
MPKDSAAKPADGRAPIRWKDSVVEHDRAPIRWKDSVGEHDRAAARALPQCRSTIRESTRTRSR